MKKFENFIKLIKINKKKNVKYVNSDSFEDNSDSTLVNFETKSLHFDCNWANLCSKAFCSCWVVSLLIYFYLFNLSINTNKNNNKFLFNTTNKTKKMCKFLLFFDFNIIFLRFERQSHQCWLWYRHWNQWEWYLWLEQFATRKIHHFLSKPIKIIIIIKKKNFYFASCE